MLGCGEYVAALAERGGDVIRPDLAVANVKWARSLSDTADATVTLAGDARCARALSIAEPWRHEIVLFRDDRRVYEGPVIGGKGTTLRSRDLTTWLDRRMLLFDLVRFNADVADVIVDLVSAAMAPDESPALSARIESRPGVRGDRAYYANQHPMIGDLVRELGRSGGEWTVKGRTMVVRRQLVDAEDAPEIVDDHLSGPIEPDVDGLLMGTAWGVRGFKGQLSDDAGDAVWGFADDTSAAALYGVVHRLATEDTILDSPSAAAAAATRLRATARPVVNVDGVTLDQRAPLAIEDLYPGNLLRLNLATTNPPVRLSVRITSVDVDTSKAEQVSVNLEPVVKIE